jgi:hypothetical protein
MFHYIKLAPLRYLSLHPGINHRRPKELWLSVAILAGDRPVAQLHDLI